jgi:anti-sigma regulatory factor (Ser/Thr protein kinase)
MTAVTAPSPVHLQILSRPELLASVRGVAQDLAHRCGLDDIASCHFILAMDETLTNVIRHGYEGRDDGMIWIRLEPMECSDGLRAVIEDRARTVDPASLQGRDLEDVKPGGLGMHLMRTLVDRFEHTPREGGGMRVVLEKRAAA